jgi:heat shock protein HslJ
MNARTLARPMPLAIMLGWLAAGCQPLPEQGAVPPAAVETAPSPGATLTEAAALVGEYRVAGVDGAGIDLPHGVAARISADRIEASAGCIQWAWRYALEAGRLTTERLPSTSCRRALLPQEQALSEAFDAARAVHRTPANGIEFSGAGRSVLLFSQ